jgi:hypothetical protein
LGLKVQKVPESSLHGINKGLGQHSQFFAKKRIIPGQDLVHEDVAIGFKPAYPPGNAHTQRKSVPGSQFLGQRQDDSAFKAGLAEFGGLDCKAGTLLSGLCPHPRLKIDNIEAPATGSHDQLLFSLE